MTRARKPSSAASKETDPEPIGRLVDAVERVEGELRLLRDVLDEIREEFQWAVRNGRSSVPKHIVHVTKMPLRIGKDRKPPEIDESSQDDAPSGKQQGLWEQED